MEGAGQEKDVPHTWHSSMVFLMRDISFTYNKTEICTFIHSNKYNTHPYTHTHLFSDILSKLTQDLIKDNELSNQSFGVIPCDQQT